MNDGGTMEPELNLLRALNLKNPDNTDFDPTTYAQFRTWLLNGNAVNMNYTLSVQLAAMKLNVEAGFVDPTQLVYAPGVTSPSDYVSIGFLMDKANSALATTACGRAYKEVLKNASDGANNNTNFVQRRPRRPSSPPERIPGFVGRRAEPGGGRRGVQRPRGTRTVPLPAPPHCPHGRANAGDGRPRCYPCHKARAPQHRARAADPPTGGYSLGRISRVAYAKSMPSGLFANALYGFILVAWP
jgi:hypothetical protein